MSFKNYKPTTSSQRHLVLLKKSFLNKYPIIKSKLIGLVNSSGRNHTGKITSFHKGGGHKQKYRIINFDRKTESSGIITSIEYDPNRTANIASVFDNLTKTYYYIIAPLYLKIGDIVKSGINAEVKLGHSLSLNKIPVGSFIHCISAQLTRSAGTYSVLIEKTRDFCRIRLRTCNIFVFNCNFKD